MAKQTKEVQKKEPELLSQEDQFELNQWLARKKAISNCQEDIDKILKKYNANLIVNPNSTIRDMRVIVVLNN